MAFKDAKEIINRAIAKEEEACSFYEYIADSLENMTIKALLKELAEEEAKHKTLLESFIKGETQKFPEHVNIVDLKITDHIKTKPIKEGSSVQDVLLYAIKEEDNAGKYYLENLGSTDNEDLKELLAYLANQELQHKVKLEKIYEDEFLQEN